MEIPKDMLDAIKLIAALKPAQIKPFSILQAGGVKLISNPQLPNDTIMISDDIYLMLKELPPQEQVKNDKN